MESKQIMMIIATAALTAGVTYLVQKFLTRTIGTSYRTQAQCEECSVRASMAVIRSLVVELSIKAGVPANEVAKIVSQICDHGCKVELP